MVVLSIAFAFVLGMLRHILLMGSRFFLKSLVVQAGLRLLVFLSKPLSPSITGMPITLVIPYPFLSINSINGL